MYLSSCYIQLLHLKCMWNLMRLIINSGVMFLFIFFRMTFRSSSTSSWGPSSSRSRSKESLPPTPCPSGGDPTQLPPPGPAGPPPPPLPGPQKLGKRSPSPPGETGFDGARWHSQANSKLECLLLHLGGLAHSTEMSWPAGHWRRRVESSRQEQAGGTNTTE